MAPGLKSYLSDLNNDMVHWARAKALRKLTEKTSYKILRNPGVARAFGLEPPGAAWPYREDADGTTLVAEISGQLGGLARPLTREGFIDRQRLALRGAEAIAAVLDFSDGDDLESKEIDLLISKCYTWYAARGRALGLPLATIAVASGAAEAPMPAANGNRTLFGVAPAAIS